jgi:penicillin G amidase
MRPEQGAKLDVGDLPRGGDGYTVNAMPGLSPGIPPQILATMPGGGDPHNQFSGGSFQIIADTEDWDNSLGLNTPGQSGDVRDPHYRDLYPLWARGRYFPIFYSRKKIEPVVEKRLELERGREESPASR